MLRSFRPLRAGLVSAFAFSTPFFAIVDEGHAQSVPASVNVPLVVITADRNEDEIQRVGSAISVVTSEDIAKRNPTSLVEVLRQVPGLDITETGGPGATASVRIRGATAGQTLVLIDGVRVNDPAGAGGNSIFPIFFLPRSSASRC